MAFFWQTNAALLACEIICLPTNVAFLSYFIWLPVIYPLMPLSIFLSYFLGNS
jgi:hypothetical protein